MDYLDKPDPQTFIAHHGIKGQKWGVRRFQNADGSLTKAGKERYNEQNSSDSSDNHENQKFHLTEKAEEILQNCCDCHRSRIGRLCWF